MPSSVPPWIREREEESKGLFDLKMNGNGKCESRNGIDVHRSTKWTATIAGCELVTTTIFFFLFICSV